MKVVNKGLHYHDLYYNVVRFLVSYSLCYVIKSLVRAIKFGRTLLSSSIFQWFWIGENLDSNIKMGCFFNIFAVLTLKTTHGASMRLCFFMYIDLYCVNSLEFVRNLLF